jgi:nucleoside-diphosphate-sugar epimerase
MNILVTGGCGYKGTVLVPKLLAAGHRVTVVDIMWFGNFLRPHPQLRVVHGDVRFAEEVPLEGIDTIIHLSSVANDPCGDLDPKLTWEISALATMQLADRAARHGVRQFIYASSGSVYGVKDEAQVTEDLELTPISEYNKTKMVGERVLLSYQNNMAVQIVRPATVCGYSPRMRLDVSVNMLTMQALTRGRITVFGGAQTRPNIHIDDITDLYMYLLERPPDHRNLQRRLRESLDSGNRRAGPLARPGRRRGQSIERSTLLPHQLRQAARDRLSPDEERGARDRRADRQVSRRRAQGRGSLLQPQMDAARER